MSTFKPFTIQSFLSSFAFHLDQKVFLRIKKNIYQKRISPPSQHILIFIPIVSSEEKKRNIIYLKNCSYLSRGRRKVNKRTKILEKVGSSIRNIYRFLPKQLSLLPTALILYTICWLELEIIELLVKCWIYFLAKLLNKKNIFF